METNNEVLLDKVATKTDIANLKTDIANLKADLIKWMFLFWTGQAAVIFGIVFTVVKFVK